jgi:hypothetical protein
MPKVWVEVEVEKQRPGAESHKLVGGVDIQEARKAVHRLYTVVMHDAYGPAGDLSRYVGFGGQVEENSMYTEGDEEAPFMTEAYLYSLLGKEEARTVLAIGGRLRKALGMDSWATDKEKAAYGEGEE